MVVGHKVTDLRCCAGHFDDEGNILPACFKCSRCGEWIRPEDINGICQISRGTLLRKGEYVKVETGLMLKVE